MSASKPIIMMIDYSWRSPEHTRSQFVFICLFSGVRLHLPDSADDRRDVSEHRTERMVFRADHVVDPLGTAAPPRPAMNSRRAMVAVICLNVMVGSSRWWGLGSSRWWGLLLAMDIRQREG